MIEEQQLINQLTKLHQLKPSAKWKNQTILTIAQLPAAPSSLPLPEDVPVLHPWWKKRSWWYYLLLLLLVSVVFIFSSIYQYFHTNQIPKQNIPTQINQNQDDTSATRSGQVQGSSIENPTSTNSENERASTTDENVRIPSDENQKSKQYYHLSPGNNKLHEVPVPVPSKNNEKKQE